MLLDPFPLSLTQIAILNSDFETFDRARRHCLCGFYVMRPLWRWSIIPRDSFGVSTVPQDLVKNIDLRGRSPGISVNFTQRAKPDIPARGGCEVYPLNARDGPAIAVEYRRSVIESA